MVAPRTAMGGGGGGEGGRGGGLSVSRCLPWLGTAKMRLRLKQLQRQESSDDAGSHRAGDQGQPTLDEVADGSP